ncbi:hypothetical protein RFI_22514 [Reticulomyxa filosa]|uniref:Uncharacterized protein n=1 Tax=Reticulomyxa filosa TaxID=46433 RepID=X6MLG3_RETFI|nr:hypothetical protein RFI_22514 [Reticulomyxa filosa]|eukprot:ETO14853.1 hypothetical protein RFI_22514 [Reticulomyxa filosa]
MGNKQNTSRWGEIFDILPCGLFRPQCVVFKNEILICGTWKIASCYSYNMSTQQYKLFYEDKRMCNGHAIIKLPNENEENEEEVTLLLLGSFQNRVAWMKYRSVWAWQSNFQKNNEWIPEEKSKGINAYLEDPCVVVGGSKNQYLFVVYRPNNISVLMLHNLELFAKGTLPIDCIVGASCFVKTDNCNQMIFFNRLHGYLITFDETVQHFQFQKLTVCNKLRGRFDYSSVRVKDWILLIGGKFGLKSFDTIYCYSISLKIWRLSKYRLPISLHGSCAIVDDQLCWLHVIGGKHENKDSRHHFKIKIADIINNWRDENEIVVIEHWFRTCKISFLWVRDLNDVINSFL